MKQLTYADREQLLQTFDSLKDEWDGSDEQLLAEVCDWAKRLEPQFGFEQALSRDVSVLSRYLIEHRDQQDLTEIARGGLLYVLLANQRHPAALGEFGLLDDAFIASYAVHEIRIRLGDVAIYNPPKLSPEEQNRAENLFLEFVETPLQNDDGLVATARRVRAELASLASCGFLGRLQKNIDFLVDVLRDSERDSEQHSYARAALSYFVCEDDAIDDRLGIIGYFDDNFVAQLAVDFIKRDREPLVELLDEVVAVWPFINSVLIDDGSGSRPASEFAILNCALSCRSLRPDDSLTTILIAPDSGPIPILIGFIACLGMAQESGQRDLTEDSFRDGQKVIVDYSAVAEFAGFETVGDRKMFKLRQYYTDRGQRVEIVRSWPLADLRRLIPAGSTRSVRGTVKHDLSRSDMLLPALEYLFNAGNAADVTAIEERIIIVTPTTLATEFCSSVKLYGHTFKDVVPMGHLATDGESVERWSGRFGLKEPILVFASDLDVATKFAEDEPLRNQLVIVDLAGRNAGKNASLRRLTRFKIPTLLIASERTANEMELAAASDGMGIWEWTEDDFSALLWPEDKPNGEPGEIVRFEQKLKVGASTEPEVTTVHLPLTAEAHACFLQLRRLAKQRGDEQIAALDDLVTLGYWITTHLLRFATPVDEQTPSLESLIGQLRKVEELANGSNYLSSDEQAAANALGEVLRQLLESLRQCNPKADAMRGLLDRYPGATIICPDARLVPDLETTYHGEASRILATCTASNSFDNGLIVPGWFRQSRMASLLSPPVANPIALVMYDVERKWYSGFVNERRTARQQRRARSDRASIFPRLKEWPKPTPLEDSPSEPAPELHEFEEVRSEVVDSYKSRIYRTITTSDNELNVPARLVMFVGGSYGFFTETYKLNVVTHLIENAIDEADEKASVLQKTANKLQPGDAIVFRLSSRDVIREVADTVLKPGTRELSSLWRKALLRFAEQRHLSAVQLCKLLRDAGCSVQQQAIQNWLNFDDMIAPQAYKRDVPAIAKATDDRQLNENLDEVILAIKDVRSAHQQKAPRILAKKVRESAVEVLKQEQADSALIRLRDDFVLVRVGEVESDVVTVRYSSTNQLCEGDAWLE